MGINEHHDMRLYMVKIYTVIHIKLYRYVYVIAQLSHV